MAQSLLPNPKPVSASEFRPAWLRSVRETIVRDKHKLQRGFPLSIEVSGRLGWHRLMLPNHGYEFATADDRDIVFAMLEGRWDIPEEPKNGG